MFEKRRSDLEMYVEILYLISKGVEKPTPLMYRANMSWYRTKEILTALKAQGLISERRAGSRRTFKITKRGRDALRYFQKAQQAIKPTRKKPKRLE